MDPLAEDVDRSQAIETLSYNYDTSLTPRDASCRMASEIILRRLVNKLFNRINKLQPTELDDEFIYQSSLSYDDYLGISKYTSEQLNCAGLNKLENVLSNFINSADIQRPSQATSLSSFSFNPFLSHGGPSIWSGGVETGLHSHLLITLIIVGLLGWFFKNLTGTNTVKSSFLSIVLVGFVQFCMDHNESITLNKMANLERCKNPSFMARMASLINYDYDNCRGDNGSGKLSNIAIITVDYLSHLIFQPMVSFWTKLGLAFNGFLNAFSGFQMLWAPFYLILVVLISVTAFYMCCFIGARTQRPREIRPVKDNKMRLKRH